MKPFPELQNPQTKKHSKIKTQTFHKKNSRRVHINTKHICIYMINVITYHFLCNKFHKPS